MSKRGKGLRGLLFEDETKEQRTPSTTPVFAPAMSYPTTSMLTPTPLPGAEPSADPSMIAEVEQALARQSSPVYSQFATLLQSLSGIPDERMRFASALSVAQTTQNLRPEAIQQAFDERLSALDGIQTAFVQQSDAEMQKRSGAEDLARLNGEMERRSSEVARLTAELAQLTAQRDERNRLIEAEQARIADVRGRMINAIGFVRNKVRTERDTVTRNLTGGK